MFTHLQLTEAGAIQRYLSAGVNIEWDANNFCTVEALVKDGKAEQFRVVEFRTAAQPAHDPRTHTVRELAPLPVDGKWTQQWEVVDLSPEQIAARRKALVPSEVTMRQARLALFGAGLLDAVDAAIAATEDPIRRRAAQIEWAHSQSVQRNRGLVIELGAALGLTELQIDDLFITAAAL